MKGFGAFLIVAGGLLLGYSMLMDTSVPSALGRVNNIGLMQRQSNALLLGLAGVVVGVVLIVVAGRVDTQGKPDAGAPGRREMPYSSAEVKDLQALIAGQGRTGISLALEDVRTVAAVRPGSSAERAGLLPGDRIVQIDDTFIGDDLRENTMRLVGPPGSTVTVTVRRGDHATRYVITRE